MDFRHPGSGDLLKIKNHKGLLIYYSSILNKARQIYSEYKTEDSSYVVISSSRKYKIFASAHGLYVQKSKLRKWLFINDANVVGGPQKFHRKSNIIWRLSYLRTRC